MHTTLPNKHDDNPAPSPSLPVPSSDPKPKRFKKVTVDGLEGVGKSSIITTILKYAVDTSNGGISNCSAEIGPIVYTNANVLLYCFSLDFMGNVDDHLEVLQTKLEEGLCSPDFPVEISMPIFLVGCKSDSKDPNFTAGGARAKIYAESIDMDGYFECSAVTGEGVPELFDAILGIVLSTEKYTPRRRLWKRKKARKSHRCVVL